MELDLIEYKKMIKSAWNWEGYLLEISEEARREIRCIHKSRLSVCTNKIIRV